MKKQKTKVYDKLVNLKKIKKPKYKALIIKSDRIVKKISVKPNDRIIKYQGFSYNVRYDGLILKIPRIFKNEYYLFYHLQSPDPLTIKDNEFNKLDFNSDIYDSMLETKVTKDLNNLAFNDFSKYLNKNTVMVGLVVISIAVYLLSGGSLT